MPLPALSSWAVMETDDAAAPGRTDPAPYAPHAPLDGRGLDRDEYGGRSFLVKAPEPSVLAPRGVYQQPFRFDALSWRVLGFLLALPARLLDVAVPIMLPDNLFRKCWAFWTLALVFYVAIDVPLQISFAAWADLPVIPTLALVTSVSFCIDVVVHFRTAYISRQGDLIRVPHLIALNYLRGMFLFDLVSALPLDEMLAATSFGNDAVWMGLLKLPRLFRLAKHVNALTRTKYVNLVGAARLLGFMLLIAHWSACLWHYLWTEVPGWPWMFSVQCATCSEAEQYLFAFYRCFLLMVGDRPDTYNNVERVFAVALLSLGACLYAVVVSSITMLVTNMWSMASRHKQRSAMLQDALRYKGASHDMRIRVDEYYNFMARFDHPGPDGVSLLAELPAALHAELLSSVFERMLIKVQLFAYCERPFLWRLAQRLRLSLFMPGDTIYDVGSVGHDMYIIWKGAVGLTARDGCMAALLADNDHFGELGLMNASTPRPHRAVALRQCDVLLLSLWDLQDAMRDFPESAELVKGRARVQLEDHEAGPALWAASLATGQTAPHELHPPLPSSTSAPSPNGWSGRSRRVWDYLRSTSFASAGSSGSSDGGDGGKGGALGFFRSASLRLWRLPLALPSPAAKTSSSGTGPQSVGQRGQGGPAAVGEGTERGSCDSEVQVLGEETSVGSQDRAVARAQPGGGGSSSSAAASCVAGRVSSPPAGYRRDGSETWWVRAAGSSREAAADVAPPSRPAIGDHLGDARGECAPQQEQLPGAVPVVPERSAPRPWLDRSGRQRSQNPGESPSGGGASAPSALLSRLHLRSAGSSGSRGRRLSSAAGSGDEQCGAAESRSVAGSRSEPARSAAMGGGGGGSGETSVDSHRPVEGSVRCIRPIGSDTSVRGRTPGGGEGAGSRNRSSTGDDCSVRGVPWARGSSALDPWVSGEGLANGYRLPESHGLAQRAGLGDGGGSVRSGGRPATAAGGAAAADGSTRGREGSGRGAGLGREIAVHRHGVRPKDCRSGGDGSVRGPRSGTGDGSFGGSCRSGAGDGSSHGLRPGGGRGGGDDGSVRALRSCCGEGAEYRRASFGGLAMLMPGSPADCSVARGAVDIASAAATASPPRGRQQQQHHLQHQHHQHHQQQLPPQQLRLPPHPLGLAQSPAVVSAPPGEICAVDLLLRHDDREPQLLVLQGQPFLGLDPLGPLFDDVAKTAAASTATDQRRRRRRPDFRPTSAAAARAGGVAPAGRAAAAAAAAADDAPMAPVGFPYRAAAGDHDTTQELVLGAVCVWDGNPRVRRSSMRLSGAGALPPGAARIRLASSDGATCRTSTVEGWLEHAQRQADRDRGLERGRGGERVWEADGGDGRVAALVRQLREAQRQLAEVHENPLQVPAFAAALKREVEAVKARLDGQMRDQLRELQAGIQGVAARAEELVQQATAAEERIRSLEARHVHFQTGPAPTGVIATTNHLPNRGGSATGMGHEDGESDGPGGLPADPLGLLSSPYNTPPPVLLPLPSANANTVGGRFSIDANRLLMQRQPSSRNARRLSALEPYGALPDSEPLLEGAAPSPAITVAAAAAVAAVAAASNTDSPTPQVMTEEDKALLAATVQRAVGSTSRRRRSALELSLMSYSSLVAAVGQQVATQHQHQHHHHPGDERLPDTQDSDAGSALRQQLPSPFSSAATVSFPALGPADGPSAAASTTPHKVTAPLLGTLRSASLRRSGRRASWVAFEAEAEEAAEVAEAADALAIDDAAPAIASVPALPRTTSAAAGRRDPSRGSTGNGSLRLDAQPNPRDGGDESRNQEARQQQEQQHQHQPQEQLAGARGGEARCTAAPPDLSEQYSDGVSRRRSGVNGSGGGVGGDGSDGGDGRSGDGTETAQEITVAPVEDSAPLALKP